MTPFVAAQPEIEKTNVNLISATVTQLQVTVVPDDAPWLYATLDQLRELKRHGGVIAGVGDLRISDATEIRTLKLLAQVDLVRDLPSPTVSVFSGGGVSLTWQVGDREVVAKVFPQGVVIGAMYENDDMVEDFETPPAHDRKLAEYLSWLIGKPTR